jgi:hypothetical protein
MHSEPHRVRRACRGIIHTSWAPPEIQPVTGRPIEFQPSGFPVPRQPIGFEISILPGPTSRAARSSSLHAAQKRIQGPHVPATRSRRWTPTVTDLWVQVLATEFAIFIKERASELAPTPFPVLLSSRLT